MLEFPAKLGGLSIIIPNQTPLRNSKTPRDCKSLVYKFLSSDTDLDVVASRQKRASPEIQKANELRAEREKDVELLLSN